MMTQFYVSFGIALGAATGLILAWMLFHSWRIRQTNDWLIVQNAKAETKKEAQRTRTADVQRRFAEEQGQRDTERRNQELQHELDRKEHAEKMRRRRDLIEITAKKIYGDYHLTLDAPGYHAETMCCWGTDVDDSKRALQSEYFRYLDRTPKNGH